MFERFNGNFSYSKKLMAVEPATLHRDQMWVQGKAVTFGNESKSGMKYISLGRMSAWNQGNNPISVEDLVHEGHLRDTILREEYISFVSSIKVYEDTSFWIADRWPLARVTENVEEGHTMLKLLMEQGRLPEGWDYWFSY